MNLNGPLKRLPIPTILVAVGEAITAILAAAIQRVLATAALRPTATTTSPSVSHFISETEL